mgnify:FL=1
MAQVKDVTTIEDAGMRAYVERINILCAKELIQNRSAYGTGADYQAAWFCAAKQAK